MFRALIVGLIMAVAVTGAVPAGSVAQPTHTVGHVLAARPLDMHWPIPRV